MASDTGSEAGAKPETAATDSNDETEGAKPQDFDEWLPNQPEHVKALITSRFSKLETALQSERSDRKAQEKELKRIMRGMDENNPLKPQLEEYSKKATESNTRADFYEEAHKRGVSNLRLAYHAAKSEGCIDDRGRVDWDELKDKVPEIFATSKPAAPPPKVNAGAGTGNGAAYNAPGGMNYLLRKAAGGIR